jgi:hypothetical protein
MAKQCGPVYLEKTIDDLVFYKMQGEYYARAKSSLTAKRVETNEKFVRTMYSANRMARASQIASAIYQALPPGWRQFWMYRSFTGEAFMLLKTELYTQDEVKTLLWNTYVEHWNRLGEANKNNPAIQALFKAKAKKVRKRRERSLESLLRLKDKYGKPKFIDPEKEEEKRQRKAMNDACYTRTMERLAKQQQQAQECPLLQQAALKAQVETTTAIAA